MSSGDGNTNSPLPPPPPSSPILFLSLSLILNLPSLLRLPSSSSPFLHPILHLLPTSSSFPCPHPILSFPLLFPPHPHPFLFTIHSSFPFHLIFFPFTLPLFPPPPPVSSSSFPLYFTFLRSSHFSSSTSISSSFPSLFLHLPSVPSISPSAFLLFSFPFPFPPSPPPPPPSPQFLIAHARAS